MFVVQTEGTSYSGRLKYLLLCNSVTVAHKLEWLEFHTHLMESSGPTQNFIETKRDWSDLSVKMDHYLGNLGETKEIAKRSYNLFNQRYLTPAAVRNYFSLIASLTTMEEIANLPRSHATGDIFSTVGQKCKALSQNFIPSMTAQES